jgi:hypothetical protein
MIGGIRAKTTNSPLTSPRPMPSRECERQHQPHGGAVVLSQEAGRHGGDAENARHREIDPPHEADDRLADGEDRQRHRVGQHERDVPVRTEAAVVR